VLHDERGIEQPGENYIATGTRAACLSSCGKSGTGRVVKVTTAILWIVNAFLGLLNRM